MSIPRWKVQIGVTLLGRNQSHALLTENVSFAGLFVRTDAPPPTMSLLRVRLDVPPDGAPIVMHGMVASTSEPESPHAVPGIDVVFFAANGEASARWNRFIEHVRDAHPESLTRPVLLARDAVTAMDRCAVIPSLPARDVTPRGLFLPTKCYIAVGADVRVSVFDPRSMARLDIDGVVRRRAIGDRDGLGVEYRNMTTARWSELAAFVRVAGAAASLSAEIRVVRAPYVPATMETLAGPWRSEDDVRPVKPPSDDSWTLPPGAPVEELREAR